MLDHPGEVFRRERQAEEIALADRATQCGDTGEAGHPAAELLAQDIALLGGLDSLGDQSKLEAVASDVIAWMIAASLESSTSWRTKIRSILILSIWKFRKY